MSRTTLPNLLLLSAILSSALAWISPAPTTRTLRQEPNYLSRHVRRPVGAGNALTLHVASRRGDDLEYLPLSKSDQSRLTQMRRRHTTVPLLIVEPMLPGQVFEFGSADAKFVTLLKHVLDSPSGEIGMVGINPHTGRPLNLGVTVSLTENKVNLDDKGMWSISVKGKRRFEVQGEPKMDDTRSFFLADVEIVDDREEPPLDGELLEQAQLLSETLPDLVDEWLRLVLSTGKSDVQSMSKRMKDIGVMPDQVGDRAFWIAALVNPLPHLDVCLEVRPAMLACKNDYDRIMLATAAIQGSIDHLTGKKKLF